MLDIKSEKIKEADEAEKIKVTVIASQGEDSDTLVQLFELEDRINSFIYEYVIEMFELWYHNGLRRKLCPTIEVAISYTTDIKKKYLISLMNTD